jgi:fumarylacetoacetate (FAA) hydrolase
MKLCMFSPRDADLERGWPGRVEDDRVIQLAAQTLQSFFTGGGRAREHAEYPLEDVVLRAPVLHPPSIRLFAGSRFQFGNPASIYGPDEPISSPAETQELRFELRIAGVIGAEGAIGGLTIMNDWTAADLEPAKDKDFATSLGPVVVTLDELGDPLQASARVNGEERLHAELRVPWAELTERATRNSKLVAGDLLGADALTDGEPLRAGDTVELEVAGLGVLRSAVA